MHSEPVIYERAYKIHLNISIYGKANIPNYSNNMWFNQMNFNSYTILNFALFKVYILENLN